MSDPDPSTTAADAPGTEPVGPESTAPDSAGDTPPSTPALTPTAQRMADVAIADLAVRIGLSESDAASTITVVSVDEVTWRDGSLGCPAKGMQYTQVLTPGSRIVLTHDGLTYEYHAGGGREPFYCATPQAPLPD